MPAVGDGYPDQDHAQPVAGSTSDAMGGGLAGLAYER
jgi:hypothetical protein